MKLRDLWPFGKADAPASRQPGWFTLGLSPYATAFPKGDQIAWAAEGYGRNATAYACINEIAAARAGIPMVLLRKSGRSNGAPLQKLMTMGTASKAWTTAQRTGDLRLRKAVEIAKIEEHPWLKLLERPQPLMGGAAFQHARTSFLLINGNCYTKKIGPVGKAPRELYTFMPHMMTIQPGNPANPIAAYWWARHTQFEEQHDPASVYHLKLFNPLDPFYGLSPISAAALALDTDNEASKWNLSLIQNSARPPGAFVTEQTLDDPDYDKLKGEVKQKMGPRAAGIPLVLDGGLKWTPFGFSPADMDWLSAKKGSRVEVCIVYGVPPELVGDNEHKTYNSFPEARKAFYVETVLPFMDVERDEWNRFLGADFGEDLFLDYDRDQIEAIQEDRTSVYMRAEQVNYLTVNEKRRMVGMDDYAPDDANPGNAILIDGSKVRLDDLGALTEQTLSAGNPGDELNPDGTPKQPKPGEPNPKPPAKTPATDA